MARNSKSARASKKPKVKLIFDEQKRKEFLCGFRKRKLERRVKAEEDMKQKLKDERKRIKQENKDSYKNMVVSRRPIPELEELLQTEREYEDNEEEVSVKIVELASSSILEKERYIGCNQPHCEKEEEVEEESEDESEEELPGMGLKEVKKTKVVKKEKKAVEADIVGKTQQEIKKMLKQEAWKKVKEGKVFQRKMKLERAKNMKNTKIKAKLQEKINKKLTVKKLKKTKAKKHAKSHKSGGNKTGGKKKGK